MTKTQALDLILKELAAAEEKHPIWPANRLRQVVVVSEEAGETLRTALTIIEQEETYIQKATVGGPPKDLYEITLDHNNLAKLEEDLEKEMAQVGAMALRWLMNSAPIYAEARR